MTTQPIKDIKAGIAGVILLLFMILFCILFWTTFYSWWVRLFLVIPISVMWIGTYETYKAFTGIGDKNA